MNLELPADARVQIFITPSNALALPDLAKTAALPALPAPAASVKSGRPHLKGAAVLLLVAAAYALGSRTGSHPDALLAHAQASAQDQQAGVSRQKLGEVPQGFTQQLQQPPVVTPPPGAAAGSGAPAKGGFGLED